MPLGRPSLLVAMSQGHARSGAASARVSGVSGRQRVRVLTGYPSLGSTGARRHDLTVPSDVEGAREVLSPGRAITGVSTVRIRWHIRVRTY